MLEGFLRDPLDEPKIVASQLVVKKSNELVDLTSINAKTDSAAKSNANNNLQLRIDDELATFVEDTTGALETNSCGETGRILAFGKVLPEILRGRTTPLERSDRKSVV